MIKERGITNANLIEKMEISSSIQNKGIEELENDFKQSDLKRSCDNLIRIKLELESKLEEANELKEDIQAHIVNLSTEIEVIREILIDESFGIKEKKKQYNNVMQEELNKDYDGDGRTNLEELIEGTDYMKYDGREKYNEE